MYIFDIPVHTFFDQHADDDDKEEESSNLNQNNQQVGIGRTADAGDDG